MADTQSPPSEPNAPKYHAPKDKSCPFCGQAFTSSSLGRHLDLYIKERNPKPSDGIHDVVEIRKMRGTITRRQPRASIGGRTEVSTPVGTPKAPIKKELAPARDRESHVASSIPKDGQYVVDSTLSKFPLTGVINDIPANGPWEGDVTQEGQEGIRRPGMQRAVSKQMAQKFQFDGKQKLSDAMDTARAAELALRELLSSWRAAKQHIDNNSMPFAFDPLSLDFPALTLQCLQPPPTLYSSTQHPTSTSWSVQSPGQREFGALKAYFQEEFRAWGVTCASATTAAVEELTYPPSSGPYRDAREAVKRAEKSAENLEKQVDEHLQSAYHVWDSLPAQRQHEVWVLELARGVGKRDKENQKLQENQHKMRQEIANLKSSIDHLNRLQQPREFKFLSPNTFPIERNIIAHAYELGVQGGKGVGFTLADRHEDLATVVTKSIERWKNVITSTRVSTTGMSAQRTLDQAAQSVGAGDASSQSQSQAATPQLNQSGRPSNRLSTSTTGAASEQTDNSTTTGPPSIEEMSDQDADAEMEDDDSFAIMNASTAKPLPAQMQQPPQLDVPRTRGHMQPHQHHQRQQQNNADPRFLMQNGAGSPVGRAAMNMSRSMPNINLAMQGNPMHGGDMGLALQGVRGDAMYME